MNLALDRAAALVATCSRCTFDDRQRADLRDILSGPVDWQRVLMLAEKNYVTPLLLESLVGDLAALVPPDVHALLTTKRRFLKFRAQLFCDELTRLGPILERAGIRVLHYKGPVASERLYGNRYLRTYFDLDFLVARDDLDAVAQLLTREGYKRTDDLAGHDQDHFEREQKEYAFVSGLLCVEPHWSLTARRYAFPVDYAGLWERAITHEFDDITLRTFAAPDLLLILSMAGAKGRWKRLQMVTDVAQLLKSMDEAGVAGVLESARALGCERILLVAAYLASVLVEAPLHDALRARIDRERKAIEAITASIVAQLFAPKRRKGLLADSPHIFSALLFAMRERKWDKLSYLWHTTTTPTGGHLKRFRLPPWAYPAYRLIVPLHDYAVMPLVNAAREWLDSGASPRQSRIRQQR
jgi:hypothetical protein